MNKVYSVNLGISAAAKQILIEKKDPRLKPVIVGRAGNSNSIEIQSYRLLDGSVAEEFLQNIVSNKEGQKLYFLGLKIKNKYYMWKTMEMDEVLNQKIFD